MRLHEFQATRKSMCSPGAALIFLGLAGTSAAVADPLASNNGFYPDQAAYNGPLNIANLDYPDTAPTEHWLPGGGVLNGPLTQDTALKYMTALKDYLEPSMRALIDTPEKWDARAAGWYDMVWIGASDGGDPTSGREAIMNTYGGQIVPSDSWSSPYKPTTQWMQNYGVIYYDELAASMLGEVWADVYEPDLGQLNFPPGSIVVKAEAATVQPDQWPSPDTGSVLKGAAEWTVFRPTTDAQKAHQADPSLPLENVVQTIYPFQLAIKVKDPVAAPQTGWVYLAYVYDARQAGTPWDRFLPAGAMWGNDPAAATRPNGLPESGGLTETWLNPDAPPFFADTLGWGGRLAAPMDVAVRHDVILPSGARFMGADGFRASSCLSCHGTAEFPFTVNLYPSPNRTFPPDGAPFPMFQPGSEKWAEWFQNRPGKVPQSSNIGGIALDYDLSTMFALGAWAAATGQEAHAFERFHVHH
ncbi:hypothetical protein ACRDNQ_09935 [Palleronia sp. KMU-117]|uniref:hypothetical protein n=1 Tax=Palleronia sp. KMU-117 TaxID=3434108 RepID=UPI003D72CCB5